MIEEWRDYPDDPIYQVSNYGRIKNGRTDRFLQGSLREDGYTQVTLNVGNWWLLHRLVLHVFVGPCPPDLFALHENDDKSNNRLDNLYYGTSAQNAIDRVRNHRAKGVDAANSKLTREQVLEICRRIDADEKFADIGRDFSLSIAAVTSINCGYRWAWLTGRSRSNARLPQHKTHARKLNVEKVKEIIRRIEAKETMVSIAKDMEVKRQTIAQIRDGTLWSHITGIQAGVIH